MKLNKLMTMTLAVGSLVPTICFSQIAMAAPPQYKVTTFFTIDRSGDGPFDNTLEVYGEVRVNGVPNGSSINRGNAKSKEAGQTLNMGEKVVTGNKVDIKAFLKDRDAATPDDDVFQMQTSQVNLAATAGSEKTFQFRSNDGAEGATLHVRVDRL
jgi:hypothetical protein